MISYDKNPAPTTSHGNLDSTDAGPRPLYRYCAAAMLCAALVVNILLVSFHFRTEQYYADNDTFYYLSLARSLVKSGSMIDSTTTPPPTFRHSSERYCADFRRGPQTRNSFA
jgi:hypothetical protein